MKHYMLSILLGCLTFLISPCLAQEGDENKQTMTILIVDDDCCSAQAIISALNLAATPNGVVIVDVSEDCCNTPTLDVTGLLMQEIEKRLKEFAVLPSIEDQYEAHQWFVPLTLGKVDKGHGNGLCSLYSARSNC